MKYIDLVMKHKKLIIEYGTALGVPMEMLEKHDNQKLEPWLLAEYDRWFCGDGKNKDQFLSVLKFHTHSNPHHWEYWDGEEIPEVQVREMIADWISATIIHTGKKPDKHYWSWFHASFDRMKLHPNTRELIVKILKGLGYKIFKRD